MHKFYQIIIVVLGFLASCSSLPGENMSLDNNKMEDYINSYKELKQKAPEYLSLVNNGDINKHKKGFSDLEAILERNGLSYMEFVKINAKVGAIYSILQAKEFMSKIEDIQSWSQKSIDDGIQQLQEAIDDPDVPEDTKKELRKNIKELEASKEQLKNEYNRNKGWSQLVLDKTKDVTNQIANESDVMIVKQYFDEITEAYTGGFVPENFIIDEFN